MPALFICAIKSSLKILSKMVRSYLYGRSKSSSEILILFSTVLFITVPVNAKSISEPGL